MNRWGALKEKLILGEDGGTVDDLVAWENIYIYSDKYFVYAFSSFIPKYLTHSQQLITQPPTAHDSWELLWGVNFSLRVRGKASVGLFAAFVVQCLVSLRSDNTWMNPISHVKNLPRNFSRKLRVTCAGKSFLSSEQHFGKNLHLCNRVFQWNICSEEFVSDKS